MPVTASPPPIPDAPVNAHLLAIGISDYSSARQLPPAQDAQDIHAVLHDPAIGAYASADVPPLIDEAATKKAIETALEALAQRTNTESSVVFYFSGHGCRATVDGKDTCFLLPVDGDPSSPERLQDTALSAAELTELLRKIPAARLTVILDCCRAAGVAEPRDAVLDPELALTVLHPVTGRGRAVLAASRADGVAWIHREQRNGVFTGVLLAGLRGGAVGRDGAVRVCDLFDYVQRNVGKLSNGQQPVFRAELEENYIVAHCSRKHLFRRLRGPLWSLVLAMLAGVTSHMSMACTSGASACEIAAEDGWQDAVHICEARYERTGDPSDQSWLGEAHLVAGGEGSLAKVQEIAEQLKSTYPVRAHYLAGMVHLHSNSGEEKDVLKMVPVGESDTRWRLRSTYVMALAALRMGKLDQAKRDAGFALEIADQLGARAFLVRARLVLADASLRSEDSIEADRALTGAAGLATSVCEWAKIHLLRGELATENGEYEQAARELAQASRVNEQCGTTGLGDRITWAKSRLMRLLGLVARDMQSDLLSLAHLAAEKGAFAEAARLLSRAEVAAVADDQRAAIARARAEVAEARGGPFHALIAGYHYNRAISILGKVRTLKLERNVCLVRGRCRAYGGLFGVLARAGRWRDLLSAILRLDAEDRPSRAPVFSYHVSPLDTPLERPRAFAATVDDVLAWYRQGLIVVIVPSRRSIGGGGERAYRLYVANGEVTGQDIGSTEELLQWRDALRRDPSDRRTAAAIERMVFPEGPPPVPVQVLVTGLLDGVPLATLPNHRMLVPILTLQRDPPQRAAPGSP